MRFLTDLSEGVKKKKSGYDLSNGLSYRIKERPSIRESTDKKRVDEDL